MNHPTNDPETWNILAIDDKQDNLLLLKAIFASIGTRIQIESDSRNYKKAIENANPNILLLDLAMPYIDGWTIRESIDSSQYVLIAITALTVDKNIRDRFLWDNHITKPCKKAEMVAAINAAIVNFKNRTAALTAACE